MAELEGDDWEDFIADIRNAAQERWPSLRECDHWLDREDHAILENRFAYVGVSEYCGLASLWIVVKGDPYDDRIAALAGAWVAKIAKKFDALFGELVHVGTFS